MNKRTTPPRRRNSGFTLIEMLIVVAIIAILIAVSIPMVNNALERARVATDAANERSAKAEATIMFLDGQLDDYLKASGDKVQMPYDAVNGELSIATKDNTSSTTGLTVFSVPTGLTKGYGKCTQAHSGVGPHSNQIIWVQVDQSGIVSVAWSSSAGFAKPSSFPQKASTGSTAANANAPHGTDISGS